MPRTKPAWPEGAMTKRDAGKRLGIELVSVEAAIRRTRNGTARVAFPKPDGWGVPPGAVRQTVVPYWLPATIEGYGLTCGRLELAPKP
jgi:hypothetical protein